jgi:oligosaccharide translocation protein RFT1
MAGFSASFILAAIAFYALQLGDVSLVYANILNLSVRIIYCVYFISSFFAKHNALGVLEWSKALPTQSVILTSTLSAVFIWISSRRLEVLEVMREEGRTALLSLPIMIHIVIGGVMGLVCLAAWWMSSGRYLSVPPRTKSQ